MASRADQDQRVYSRSYLTKLRVAEAMDRLCAAMPFARVRIEDIVRESGVSRSNFYHNFSDKNAVVTWIAEQCHANGIFRIGRDLTWFEGHMITTRDMARFRTLFNSAAGSTEYAAGALPYGLTAVCNDLVAMTPRELYEALEHPVANAAPGELAELR